jgi:serine/threonine protein kinase
MVGTLGFCAPEQISGKAETRSDIFSIAATLYHMLSGELPQHSLDPLELIVPGLGPGLDRIVARGTEPRLGNRYSNAHELAEDLRAWQNGFEDGHSPGPSAVASSQATALMAPAVPTQVNRTRAWAIIAGLAAGLGIALGLVSVWSPAVKSSTVSPSALAESESIPIRKGLDETYELGAYKVHSEGFTFGFGGPLASAQSTALLAFNLNDVPQFHRDWQFDERTGNTEDTVIAMKGAGFGGGYILRPQGKKVYVLTIVPAPIELQLFHKLAEGLLRAERSRPTR